MSVSSGSNILESAPSDIKVSYAKKSRILEDRVHESNFFPRSDPVPTRHSSVSPGSNVSQKS